MIGGVAAETTTPRGEPAKEREKPKTHPRSWKTMHHLANEVSLLLHLKTHRLIAFPARHVVRSICFTPPITCNPVPAPETQQTLGRNGHWGSKQATGKALQFYEHVGSVDSKGTAKTRKAKMEAQFPVNTFREYAASVSLHWLTVTAEVAFAPTRPGTMPMHRSCGMGVERQQSRANIQGTYLLALVVLFYQWNIVFSCS